jgi:hypothetical protein
MVIYSTDASLEQSTLICYIKDDEIIVLGIDDAYIYKLEIFDSPSDSFINESDLIRLNDSCDMQYVFDEKFDSIEKKCKFMCDMFWYFGGVNFDSSPEKIENNLEVRLNELIYEY